MDPLQNLISVLRANDWGVAFSGSWIEDESMLDQWSIVTRDGSIVNNVNIPVEEKVVERFASYLYNCFDTEGFGINEKWFPGTATPCAAFKIEKHLEALTWNDIAPR
jgi:hypothetical protein